ERLRVAAPDRLDEPLRALRLEAGAIEIELDLAGHAERAQHPAELVPDVHGIRAGQDAGIDVEGTDLRRARDVEGIPAPDRVDARLGDDRPHRAAVRVARLVVVRPLLEL